ncbi:response regulator [Paenibacillus psychroresistens]|uniref:Circadian input-output histidine kinase CikA n=1 Tax=Paenibacillus psychroresistens TaxID=1778678 RepID=A0A6B8RMJ4_9BACL|nr:response regulator [Paenibacillus psychroresistens]QGQ96773.1 response regulator [Paenibacillus psychroresistens]
MSEIELLRRQLEREKTARKEAERITELKTREIYYINQDLRQLNEHLEEKVNERTSELERAHDEAIEANLIKSQFLANMSHELRTPLNAIIGYSEMLIEEAEEIHQQSIADDLLRINKSGKHLLSLINDILDISKIEAGKMDIYYEENNVLDLIQDVLTTVKPLVKLNGNLLETQCVDGRIAIDTTKLRQILINLLSNASKFTKNGMITFDVYSDQRDQVDGYSFRVKDTGIGMTSEQMDRLFQPFTQADSSMTRKFGGTGLGLAISKRFSEMMNGSIQIESEMNQGSIFTCWLPKDPILQNSTVNGDLSEQGYDIEDMTSVSILFIDDELSNQQLMQRYLAKEGWSMAFADSGQEGLRLAKKLRPKVICLDILMPSMDGWSVLSAMKSDPELENIPVIILSLTNDKYLGYTLGAAEFITKPINRDRLIEVMDKYMFNRSEHTVLVIEDDKITSEMMTRLLQKEGYSVTEANNGRSALASIENKVPKLILLDLMMPEMDGFQFILELQKKQAWTSIPIVVVTAKSVTADERLKLNGYVKEIVQKGMFNKETFLAEIRGLIEGG